MYTIVIDDVVEVPVKFAIKSGKVFKTFALTLTARRLGIEEANRLIEDCERNMTEFLRAVVTGWADQRLVMGPDGEPAAFSPEAFGALMNVTGVANACFAAYSEACVAKGKN